MNKNVLVSTLLFFFTLGATTAPYSLVFIHLGPSVPTYLSCAIKQARLFNQTCPIYLLTDNTTLLSGAVPLDAHIISTATLASSDNHLQFRQKTTLDKHFRNGFWLNASERFLVLHDFMEHSQLKNVFHLENDTMLYVDLEELLPIFLKQYPHIGAVFDNDDRCIPCFVYLANTSDAEKLASCFSKYAARGYNDMQVLGVFKKESPSCIATLPIIMPDYVKKIGLRSPAKHTTATPDAYINNFEDFNSIFDAAALGQFLGGIDPRNAVSKPGFINESCLFNPSLLSFEWIKDNCNRKVPYASFDGKKYRINTLHIHSKKLELFLSEGPTCEVPTPTTLCPAHTTSSCTNQDQTKTICHGTCL